MLDSFKASLDAGGGDLALVPVCPFRGVYFAALLLVQLFQLGDGVALGFQLNDGGGFGSIESDVRPARAVAGRYWARPG